MAQPEPRKEWNYAPELPIGNNPLFDWPLNVRAIFIYYRDSWLTLSEVSLFAILAIGGWWVHQAGLGGVAAQLSHPLRPSTPPATGNKSP